MVPILFWACHRKARKDQAALTVLAHKAGYSWEGTDSEDIGILFHQDIDADVEFVDCRATIEEKSHDDQVNNDGFDGGYDVVDVVLSLRVVCHDAHHDQQVCCIRGMPHVGAFGIPPYYVLLGDPHFEGKPEFLCNSKGIIEIKQTYPKMAIEEGIESEGDVKTSGGVARLCRLTLPTTWAQNWAQVVETCCLLPFAVSRYSMGEAKMWLTFKLRGALAESCHVLEENELNSIIPKVRAKLH